jgi:hypothetical protein
MQFQQAPTQMREMNRASPEASMPIKAEPSIKEIPYDYVATFKLLGKQGNRVQDVINISTEGAFVANAIGYSFIPTLKVQNGNVLGSSGQTDSVEFATAFPQNPLLSLIEPFVRPVGSASSLPSDPNTRDFQQLQLIKLVSECLLVKLCGIQFKYSIVDSGSGRELQNQPIHNIAGLGESSGDRPFRPFAKPMIFMPRSTIRIEIEEISEGPIYTDAQLYIVLHGYKMLGYGTGLP